ncbi:alpha/beta hydrolase family protein [Zoogloea sp.]|uniref:alpha/beta hydrolase family protein n=1 Tax=Zoogloea sp. TaxID=49181 RepID=UPI0035B32ABF
MDGPLTHTPAAASTPAAAGLLARSQQLLDLHDTRRARTLPLKLYLPEGRQPHGLILFSHGLGGSREGGADWLAHWCSHGFAALAVQHPGSDASLLRNNSPLGLRHALKAAMNPDELARRAEDIRFVLSRIGRDPALAAIADIHAIGLAGHSFGAVTVQLVAGEHRPRHLPVALDPRIRAVLALSPSARFADQGPSLDQRFGGIHLPFFSITGSRDDGMGLSDITAANRELPYRHMPAGDKYLLVFAGGNHLDFAGQASAAEGAVFRLRREPPPFQHALLAASTAFWQAYLQRDDNAHHWLTTALTDHLRSDDRFEFK